MIDYKKIREEEREPKWRALAEAIGGELGEEIVQAMKELYDEFSDELIDWFVDLYDSEVGGFYYSRSAKATDGYLPDAESTQQALRFFSGSGLGGASMGELTSYLPPSVKEKIRVFIKGLQDPNGFFYHPQWGKEFTDTKASRRARDLGWCIHILSSMGEKPTYDTPNGYKGDGLLADGTPAKSASAAASGEQAPKSTVAIPPEMKDRESFEKFIGGLDIKNQSYSVGNLLTSISSQIAYRDEVLRSEGADYSLTEILIGWLNENQNPENGTWHAETNYYAVNGLMKTSGVYGKANVMMPNAGKAVMSAIDAMTTDEVPNAVTCVYNTWFAVERVIRHMRTLGGEESKAEAKKILAELRRRAPEALRLTREKLRVFRKECGSYSYCPTHSATRSQGCPAAVADAWEGDINATIICSSDILNYIYAALDLYEYRVPIFSSADAKRFYELIEAK